MKKKCIPVGDMKQIKKMKKYMSEGLKTFLKELDMEDYIEWCIKSSSDPKETVECFQEIIPICRFDHDCKKKIKEYADKHGLDFDVETGNVEFNTYGYGKVESKHIVEQYLSTLQEDEL
jgi:ribosomal protein S3AE